MRGDKEETKTRERRNKEKVREKESGARSDVVEAKIWGEKEKRHTRRLRGKKERKQDK